MRRSTVLAGVTAVVFGAATAFAQGVSFAGHWTAEAPAGNGAGGPVGAAGADAGGGGGGRGGRGGGGRGGRGAAGGFGQEFWASQDDKALTITRVGANGDTTKTIYNLDGSESPNAVAAGRGNPVVTVSTAKWDGKTKLVITSKPPANARGGGAQESTTTLWMDGSSLKVDSVRPGANGAAPAETLTIYRKGKG